MKKQLLLFLMMLLPMVASADVVEINGVYYNLIKGEFAEVTSNPNKYSGSVVIPESVEYEGKKYSVTSIVASAFYNCSGLTSVTIGNSVTSIGDYAFDGCSGLTSVTIGNSVTSIGNAGFAKCSGLTSLTIGNSVTSIGGSAFSYCSSLTSVTIPNSVTSIGLCAFYKCSSLTSVTIPNSVTSISDSAFQDCSSLTSVTIPNSVTSLLSQTFMGCSGLTSVTIPNSMTSIGDGAFWGCGSLTSLTIPNSVTSIGKYTFSDCSGLTSVTIPNSVSSIGAYAFWGCNGLTSVTIGSGVKSIDNYAFKGCEELKDVYCLAENVPGTYTNAFDDSYPEYTTLHVPANSLNAYKATEPWSSFGKIVSLDGSGTEVKKCATPTISYQFGQLSFSCETEDVTFVSEITDYDIKKSYDASLYLTATYYISVYATKDGYENSDVATATLSWMDAELFTDDISGGAATVRAKAVLIQSNGSMLSIAGADEGTAISVYDMSGKMVGSATAASENTNMSTPLRPGDIALVKIGEKTIKVLVK